MCVLKRVKNWGELKLVQEAVDDLFLHNKTQDDTCRNERDLLISTHISAAQTYKSYCPSVGAGGATGADLEYTLL